MEPREIAAAARSFSAMARIVGPDPKAVKMRRHAFHLHQSGSTTLSASAVLLPPGALADPPPLLARICASHGHAGGVALTAASLVEAFLVAEQRDSPSEELQPRLVPEARLDVLVEAEESGNISRGDSGAPQWLSAELLAMVDVPASADSVSSLLTYDGSLIGSSSWDVGWPLADVNQKQVEYDAGSSLEYNRKNVYAESVDPSTIAKSATRIAILGVSALTSSNARHINVPPTPQRGDSLLVVGSPFGILSPFHFFNSISVGAVANCLPPGAVRSALLMADIHCLPGMEGAPVFDKNSCLVGMLMKPLRQRGSNIQVQLVITWEGICTAWSRNKLELIEQVSNELLDDKSADSKMVESCSMDNHRRFVSNSANDLNQYSIPPSLREAISSVVLVTVGDTTWASGILLNKNGLVLTNAHLLEPWRFGRTSPLGLQHKTTSLAGEYLHGENKLLQSQHCKMSNEDSFKHEVSFFNLGSKREKRISVRLDDGEKQTWCSASVVFISKGPLDVALLQMEKIAIEFCAIRPEFVCPTAGSSAYVVGHGLLGPRSGLCSSLSSGVVSKVVQIPSAQHSHLPSNVQTDNMDLPVMLQTTAAVHPGSSGGVIVNSHGRMVGLITSNAKHGGGSTIPRLNFSIPCKSLEMVFKYAANGDYTILEQLDKPNELLSSVWALAQAPSSLPFLSSPPGKSGEGKVSEFSKFLANQKEGLTSISDLEAFLKHKIPSKI
ncbi:glyoxysomal processing protease, glyoxysomal [Aegilops tauschii subsp. strangulata]|nr:glyoxysomal processing protease, glyoxysomal [Aegilops tauschii subsp. strangulata]XP_044451006.1 glyoxysomal processing protease, glyoxysomal-like [Triticum aestivum]